MSDYEDDSDDDYSDFMNEQDEQNIQNELDYESSDDEENNETNAYNNKMNTDGVLDTYNKNKLSNCKYCEKWFEKELIIPSEKNKGQQCQHCFFWQNYNIDKRKEADSKYIHLGISIVNYVLNCSDDHNFTQCKKNRSDCFLCDYKAGKKIENINNYEILYPNSSCEEQNTFEIELLFDKLIKKNIYISKYVNKTIDLNI